MWLYAKAAIIAVLSIALIVGGWKAATWRLEAQAAEVLRLELRAELERRVKADADRLSLQVKLSEAEAKIGTGVKIVTKSIREFIHDTAPCRITNRAVIDGLRSLRAGEAPVSPAPAQPANSRAAP
jgi:hypothetical protein